MVFDFLTTYHTAHKIMSNTYASYCYPLAAAHGEELAFGDQNVKCCKGALKACPLLFEQEVQVFSKSMKDACLWTVSRNQLHDATSHHRRQGSQVYGTLVSLRDTGSYLNYEIQGE